MNSWIRKIAGEGMTYKEMDALAATVKPGSEGLFILPFGNGVERMLQNQLVDAHVHHLDLNLHSKGHLFRAVQEGIAFAFRYGLDIMRENGLNPTIIRAGKSNLFLSDLFVDSFVNATGVPVELYENDGSVGAALGAGIGAGIYKNYAEAFANQKMVKRVLPENIELYEKLYQQWKKLLAMNLKNGPA